MEKPETPKSKVIKSKSSNSAIATKPDYQRNLKKKSESRKKKSKSNGEFQTLAVTKRGVYVENKLTKISLNAKANETIDEIQTVKPPPRPKAGSKRFLASVLAILSKSTTGTQYPDTEGTRSDKKSKINKKVTLEKEPVTPIENEKKKKPKYKSKVLNDNKYQVDKFEVLQSKKEIIQTPSLYSEKSNKEDIKWSDLPRLVKHEDEEEQEAIDNHINNLVREVTEGKMIKAKKVVTVVDPEPPTLVSEHKDDKRLYNFFVDLLETTFSVYNVKAEFDAAPLVSAVSSHIAPEMDESVARKLYVSTDMYDKIEKKPSKHYYCIRNDNDGWNDENLIDFFQENTSPKRQNELPLKSPNKRRKMQSESFAFSQRSRIPPPEAQSVVVTRRKSFYKKTRKRDLLNILKEQLNMDNFSFEEPQNLYQALKVMAKNKRKQKTIHFDRSTKRDSDDYRYPECMLPLKRRRKVLSPNTKSVFKDFKTNGPIPKKISDLSGSRRKYSILGDTTDEDFSSHSLEVYGFDYEVPKKNKRPEKKPDEFFRMYHSPSESDFEDCNEVMKFNTGNGSSSTIRDFISRYQSISKLD